LKEALGQVGLDTALGAKSQLFATAAAEKTRFAREIKGARGRKFGPGISLLISARTSTHLDLVCHTSPGQFGIRRKRALALKKKHPLASRAAN